MEYCKRKHHTTSANSDDDREAGGRLSLHNVNTSDSRLEQTGVLVPTWCSFSWTNNAEYDMGCSVIPMSVELRLSHGAHSSSPV